MNSIKKQASSSQKLLYRIGLKAYVLGIRLASPFNRKARKWLKGRKNWRIQLKDKLSKLDRSKPLLWMHCASVGEFEQGRPLLEAWREKHPNYTILLSFFSPSGFLLHKNYTKASAVTYLPIDNAQNAKDWLKIVQPNLAIFVKYEFWYYYLTTLKAEKIPTYLIAANFRENQLFFKPKGQLFREMLDCFTTLFVQNEDSIQLLKSIDVQHAKISGDPRMDRVLDIRIKAKEFPYVDTFSANSDKVLIAGSTWPADLNRLKPALLKLAKENWKFIIAPHEVSQKSVAQIENLFSDLKLTRYSQLGLPSYHMEEIKDYQLLIIDNIGMLSSLYRYANYAYVGGGFGKGIHNILEAAVYHIPVLIGPRHKKFVEAQDLLKLGVAFEIQDAQSALKILQSAQIDAIKQRTKQYFETQRGASQRILQEVEMQLHEK